jgi:uncharacterized protein (TIGR03435 family)
VKGIFIRFSIVSEDADRTNTAAPQAAGHSCMLPVMGTRATAGIFLLAFAAASGQQPPSFEVASVKLVRDSAPLATMNGDISHGRLTLNNAHIKQLIAVAYEIQSVRIQGGPGWIDTDQFQISAKAADPATSDKQVRAMLQTLLAGRFHLKIHRETRLLPGFTLRTAPEGAKLPKAQQDGADRCDRTAEGNKYDLVCGHVQIATLANALALMLRSPVVDETGLTGDYDFTLSWDDDDMYAGVPDAVEKFGLKLEMKKVPTEVLVIDSVERPSDN